MVSRLADFVKAAAGPVAASALLRLAFPAWDLHALAWVALTPLLVALPCQGPGKAFLSWFATGYMFFGALMWWALARVSGFNAYNFGLGDVVHAIPFGLFGLGAWFLRKRFPSWVPLTLPGLWVLIEYLRSHVGFVSFPYGVLGLTQYRVERIANLASVSGVYGVSFLLVAVNVIAAEALGFFLPASDGVAAPPSRRERGFRGTLAVFAGVVVAFAGFHLQGADPVNAGNRSFLKVGLVQGNVYWEERDAPARKAEVLDIHERLTRELAPSKPDLIVWPSSSVPGLIPFEKRFVDRLGALARESGSSLLVGSAGFDKLGPQKRFTSRMANSAFLFSPEGNISGRYDKVRLLPFDEYVPMREHVRWPSWVVDPRMKDYVAGTRLSVFQMQRARFCVLICWEYMFPDQFREMASQGVDFMVAMTNEAFTNSSAAHLQFLAMVAFRAIENRVPVLRTATSGISGIIDSRGKKVAAVVDGEGRGCEVAGILVTDLPLRRDRSFYNRHGDLFVFALGGALALFFALGLSRDAFKSIQGGTT